MLYIKRPGKRNLKSVCPAGLIFYFTSKSQPMVFPFMEKLIV